MAHSEVKFVPRFDMMATNETERHTQVIGVCIILKSKELKKKHSNEEREEDEEEGKRQIFSRSVSFE